ncbi:MAG TPA: Eco57I restriction-modification methylase domain-containing protein, partial [Methanoregula sp.]|nr:Eco57I restriction-modification methylase domain-containing protein [Methanoregula sp.]
MPASIASDNSASLSLSNDSRILLTILESARDLLSRSLVQECHAITEQDLNYTILSSILQVIFLKTGQEAGFVEPGTLALLADTDGINRRLARACSDAGLNPDILFEKGPEGFHTIPPVPDDALRQVIRCMDSGKFPVPVCTLPLEHLTVVFEHFLGTRMQVNEGYRVKRTGKSAVLYTGSVNIPAQPVVEYVVKKTIADIFRNKGTGDRTGIRILDPACGAGIFLLASYRFLIRCRTGYTGRQHTGELMQDLACQSVYGTDIDPDSVSAARFIMLLSFIEERLLSGSGHISSNRLQEICECLKGMIRSGNALIDRDYFCGRQEHPFNAEERRKVNAFSWQEAFPQILDSGGFDVVIGAPPPYTPFTVRERDEYFQTHYDVYAKGAGLYGYFIEKGLQILRPRGALAFCMPDTFLRSNHTRALRKFMLTKQIEEIVYFGEPAVLQTGNTHLCIIRVSNNKPTKEFYVSKLENI